MEEIVLGFAVFWHEECGQWHPHSVMSTMVDVGDEDALFEASEELAALLNQRQYKPSGVVAVQHYDG